MKTKVVISSGGISTLGILGVVFIALKLTHTIDWSWWWVSAPFWGVPALVLGGPIVLLIGGGVVVGIVVAISWLIGSYIDHRRRKAFERHPANQRFMRDR